MKTVRNLFSYGILFIFLTQLSGCQSLFFSSGAQPTEEVDTGCAYFYFLWGRQAELSYQFDEALEAYQKALICDPNADYIIRKIPIILLRLNRGEEAVDLLRKYLEENPGDESFMMLLARVYAGLEKYDEAIAEYKKMHEKDPAEISSLLLLSELYLNRDMLPEAEQVLGEVQQIKPDSYAAHVLLARIYFNSKRYEKAAAEYNAALKLNWSADLLMEKAELYSSQNMTDKVAAIYRQILNKDPGNEQASIALINLLLRENKEEEAIAELNRFKENSELSEKVELSIARLYARMGKYDQAIEILRNSLQKKESGEVRYFLAILLIQTEQYEQALQEASMVSPHEQEYEDLLMLQVRILRHLDRQEEAISLLEKAVADAETRSPDMYAVLATLYLQQKEFDKGKAVFDRAMKAFPENNELLYDYGVFLDSSGRPDEAISVMQEVIKRDPRHGGALNYVGYSWAEKNIHLDKALKYILRAVKLKPESGYVMDSLGWVYYRLSRFDEARDALEEAIELSGDDPDPLIFEHLGDVYFKLGNKTDALDAYRQGLSKLEDGKDAQLKKAFQEKIQLLEKQEKE